MISLITGKEKLSKSVAEQKWDRIKLVCTQPYNKVHNEHNASWLMLYMLSTVLFNEIMVKVYTMYVAVTGRRLTIVER